MFQFSSLLQHLLLIYLQYNLSKTIVKLCFTVDLPYGISRLLKQCIILLYFAWADQRVQPFYNYHIVCGYRTVVGYIVVEC